LYILSLVTDTNQTEEMTMATMIHTNDSRTATNAEGQSPDPSGFNVWRFLDDGDVNADSNMEFVGSRTTLAMARELAKSGDQIQQGLDGGVTNV
jgi:hypothetical protein